LRFAKVDEPWEPAPSPRLSSRAGKAAVGITKTGRERDEAQATRARSEREGFVVLNAARNNSITVHGVQASELQQHQEQEDNH
jgi:hypothetical protein